jgi:hypothetical protein
MARITTTSQKKNTMIPGIAYPATVLLATDPSYPALVALFRICEIKSGIKGEIMDISRATLPGCFRGGLRLAPRRSG